MPVKVAMAYEIEGKVEVLPVYNVFPGYYCQLESLGSDKNKAFRITCREDDNGASVTKILDQYSNGTDPSQEYTNDQYIHEGESLTIPDFKASIINKTGDLIITHYRPDDITID